MGDDDRVAGRLVRGGLEAQSRKIGDMPVGAGLHLLREGRVGRDRSDPDDFEKPRDRLVEIGIDACKHAVKVGHGSSPRMMASPGGAMIATIERDTPFLAVPCAKSTARGAMDGDRSHERVRHAHGRGEGAS